jgi:hypothetical protein
MTKEPHELIVFGTVKRLSSSPGGNSFALVDINNKNAVLVGDDILEGFEGKGNICLHIKMIRRKI